MKLNKDKCSNPNLKNSGEANPKLRRMVLERRECAKKGHAGVRMDYTLNGSRLLMCQVCATCNKEFYGIMVDFDKNFNYGNDIEIKNVLKWARIEVSKSNNWLGLDWVLEHRPHNAIILREQASCIKQKHKGIEFINGGYIEPPRNKYVLFSEECITCGKQYHGIVIDMSLAPQIENILVEYDHYTPRPQ
jgi:hypothetical protein